MVTPHGPQIQQAYDAANLHAARSKGPFAREVDSTDPPGYDPTEANFPPSHQN